MTRTNIVGIVNVTPDSFSDGGEAFDVRAAVARVYAHAQAGADIIDIGAESTRPGATALGWREEWARLAPVLEALRGDMASGALTISVDTYHPETAAQALDAGVHIINDVGGLRDAAMRQLLATCDGPIISMHALSLPVNRDEQLPPETDMAAFLDDWVRAQLRLCDESGIARERLVLDPGLGFGKSAQQSLGMMQAVMARVHTRERWLIGHSRKSFLKQFTEDASERDMLTRGFSALLMQAGIAYIRVHDVAGHVALREAVV